MLWHLLDSCTGTASFSTMVVSSISIQYMFVEETVLSYPVLVHGILSKR